MQYNKLLRMKYVNGTVELKKTVTTFLNKYPNKQAFCKRFKNTYNEYKNDILEKDARKAKKEIKRYIIDNYGRKSYNTFADYVQAYNNYLDYIIEKDAHIFCSKFR